MAAGFAAGLAALIEHFGGEVAGNPTPTPTPAPAAAPPPPPRPVAPPPPPPPAAAPVRSEEHTSELQSLMRISYAVFRFKKNTKRPNSSNANIATADRIT